MLTWNKKVQEDQAGTLLSKSYRTQIPHWGEANVHPHIHHPGEMFLDCPTLDINMHPLGQGVPTDALKPAEAVLMRTLEQHAVWCLEAMAVIGSAEEITDLG